MGRGSSSTEQRGFGIDDPELTKEMLDEVMPEFKKMWRENDYSFKGKFFSMPPRNVLPKPYSDPHPPMWIAAGNPGTFEKAARMGLGVLCFTMGAPETLAPLIEVYKKNIEKAEPVGEYVNNNIMVTSQMLCLEDGQKARDIACNMTSGYQNSLVFHYLDTFPRPPGIPEWPALIPEPTLAEIDADIKAGNVCIGTPDEVKKAVKGYADAGADQLVFGMLSTTMPIEVAVEAVETFGKHVIPEFDKDPVHSTTRQREAFVAKRGPSQDRARHRSRQAPRHLSKMAGALAGRVALVTGASRGIGAAIAQRFAAEGAAVAVTARTLEPDAGSPLEGSLQETLAILESFGGRTTVVAADLSDADARARIVPEVEQALGPIDVLVNNAAAAMYMPNAEIPLKRRRLTFEINVHAPLDLIQAALPGMRDRKQGWIVNISSATSKHPKGPPFDPGFKMGFTTGTYGASKAALERFTTGLAAELFGDTIAVNSLAPVAAVRTPGADALVGDVMDANPDIVEPVELFVEATLALATCDPLTTTGQICYSRPLLDALGRDYRELDGSERADD